MTTGWLGNDSTLAKVSDPLDMAKQFGMGGSWFDPANFFGMGPGLPNPADAAMGYFDQVPGTIKPYYDPYINAGKDALGTLQGQYNTLLNDPNSLMAKLGGGFQQSPGYQFQKNEAMNAANNAAASGGMLGTPYHQQQAAGMVNNLANQDYYNFLNNSMGLYGKGLSGYEGINQTGYNASNELAGSLASNLMNQGQLAYQGQASSNEAKNAGMGNLAGVVGMVGKMFSGGMGGMGM